LSRAVKRAFGVVAPLIAVPKFSAIPIYILLSYSPLRDAKVPFIFISFLVGDYFSDVAFSLFLFSFPPQAEVLILSTVRFSLEPSTSARASP